MEDWKLINVDTGEIKPIEPGTEIISPKQRNARRNYRESHAITDRRRYTAAYNQSIAEDVSHLSLIEKGAIWLLGTYMSLNVSDELKGALFSGGKRMGTEDVAVALGRHKRTASRIVKTLVEGGVLVPAMEGKRKVFSVNPKFHSVGRQIDRDERFTKVYQVKARRLASLVSLQACGLMYSLIPYMHYRTYDICVNPDEADLYEIRPASVLYLAETLGMDVETVHSSVRELSRVGALAVTGVYGTMTMRVNPEVMSRVVNASDDPATQETIRQFATLRHTQRMDSEEADFYLTEPNLF